MSYTNPKIYAADPLAFSQAFMQGFKNTFDAFQKVAENVKKQKERDDLIQADLIKFKNIGDLEGVNASVNNGIQQSIDSVIDAGTFAKKSAVERQKDLNDVTKLKAGSQAFVQLYAIDLDELSNKSKLANPELDAVLTQLKADPNKVQITGDKNTIDVKFTTTTEGGITHTVSLRDMSKYLATYKSIAEDEADWEKNIDADSKIVQALIEDDARKGIEGDLRATRIAEHLNKKGTLDADTSSYLFYEKISDDKKGGVSEWHPTEDPLGNKLDEELRKEIWAAQDKLVQDVYTEELQERIYTINVKPKPEVVDTSTDLLSKAQKANKKAAEEYYNKYQKQGQVLANYLLNNSQNKGYVYNLAQNMGLDVVPIIENEKIIGYEFFNPKLKNKGTVLLEGYTVEGGMTKIGNVLGASDAGIETLAPEPKKEEDQLVYDSTSGKLITLDQMKKKYEINDPFAPIKNPLNN